MESCLGDGIIKEDKFSQYRKPCLIGVSGEETEPGEKRKDTCVHVRAHTHTHTHIMPINAITSQEVAQMLLSTVIHGTWEGGLGCIKHSMIRTKL